MHDVTGMSIASLQEAMARGETSAEEIAAAFLARIREKDNAVGAYLTVTEEEALAQARAVDARRARGLPAGALAGIPAAYKDNLCTRGVRTTCASKLLADYRPPYDAAAVERLQAAGAVMLGKTNLDEFAMGSSTEHSALGRTRNPRDLSRVPGGSSGGSAAAVAAGEAAFALGSDTGGSVRQPAALCGVVGMRPTYGAVSRWGLVAFASSMDEIGPLTRTVADSARVLEALCGHDVRDMTSARRPCGGYVEALGTGVRGLSIALPEEMFGEGVAPEVAEAVERGARLLERKGARLCGVRLPALRYALPAYYILSSAEASSNLARFDGVRYGRRAQEARDMEALYAASRSEGFGPEVKRRILLGTFALSAGDGEAYWRRAQRARAQVRAQMRSALEAHDLLLSPTAPSVAWRAGEKADDPVSMYRSDLCTVPASLAGLPALSMPCGTGKDGLPVGLQLMGRAFAEGTIYRAAQALEEAMAE